MTSEDKLGELKKQIKAAELTSEEQMELGLWLAGQGVKSAFADAFKDADLTE